MDKYKVPFHLFRVGAVIEFDVCGIKRVERGTVQKLVCNGARNMLAVLSRVENHLGEVQVGANPATGMRRTINLAHAVRMVTPGTGPLVFERDDTGEASKHVRKEVKEAQADGTIVRRGHRLVLRGDRYLAGVVRSLVYAYFSDNRDTLGFQPWEIFDLDRAINELRDVGIIRYTFKDEAGTLNLPVKAELNTVRMKKFFRSNFNRFKCDLNALQRERIRLDDEYARSSDARDDLSWGTRTGRLSSATTSVTEVDGMERVPGDLEQYN